MHLRLVIFCSLLYVATNGVLSTPLIQTQYKEDDLIVELDNLGKIRGHILQSSEGNDFYAFQEIPYAEPPVGKLRFRPPQPHRPWDGVLNATENKKICTQKPDPNSTEDCLVLNVYTPVKPSSNNSLPVFFWIPGGAFVTGSGSIVQYNPKLLIDYDIIVVTINYRLGAFGFLTTLDENIPGNLGLKDQHLALKWTHDNIHKFGGDPKKITVSGESAGSMSVGFHLLSRLSKGLFRSVIQQSGSSISGVFYPTNDRELAFEFGKALNSSFTSTESSDLLELLQQANYSDLVELHNRFTSGRTSGFMDALTFKPVLEDESNEDAFITGPMHDAVLNGHFNLVPILIGLNSEESLMFLLEIDSKTIEERGRLLDQSPKNLVSRSLNIDEEERENVGRRLKKFYTSSSFTEDINGLYKFTSDEVFSRSIIRQAETASQYVPVYLYELSWLADNSTDIGVPHAADLWYLWDLKIFDSNNEKLRKPILKWWTNFVKYQNPTPDSDEDLQNVIWPKVQPNAVKYLDIDSQFTVKENPRNYYSIKALLDDYIQPPYISY
ncbi:juvenile hormone esterase-like [Diabrotica undecimpunctata]|uniref:juvenile hormone esterase-like n=1 Tax=Diabrotica undecimpunctata TaxID=50387 RepID=UPI003B64147F